MEIRIGSQRVCGMTIDRYLFYSGKDPEQELTESQKIVIVTDRMKKLNEKEGQRWTPFLGFYRMLKDCANGDNLLLSEMHPARYTFANVLYNASTTLVGAELLLNYLFK
jgi:hypothetical protein